MTIQYYLIHNNDLIRKERMINEFIKAGINLDDIKWIIKPERNEITMEFINKFVADGITKTNNRYINAQNELSIGVMICSFKHYLALAYGGDNHCKEVADNQLIYELRNFIKKI